MDQYIGKLLDNRYEIIERIGTGGMAVVYKGRDHRLNRLGEEKTESNMSIRLLLCLFSRDI